MKITDQFSLNPLEVSDAKSLHELMVSNAERIGLFLPVTLSQNKSFADTEAYISRKIDENVAKSKFTFTIKEDTSNVVAGLVILKNIDYQTKQGEFAYCLGDAFKGQGLMSKSVKTFLEFAVQELGLKKFQIITHVSNISSVKVATNNGFSWVKTLIGEFKPKDRAQLDMELYELKK